MKTHMAVKAHMPEFFETYRAIHSKIGITAITVGSDGETHRWPG